MKTVRGGRPLGFVANSAANLAIGAATLGYAVVVPAVVARRFGIDLYGTWYLAFQIAAYVILLDLGSQYVVTNEAATPDEGAQAARITTAAMVAQAGLASAVVVLAALWAGLSGQGTLARLVAILGVAAVGSLLASTVRAWYAGLQRAHVPAAWMVASRVAAMAGLAAAVLADAGLVAVTTAVAAPALLVHLGLLAWSRRPPSPWARPDRAAFARLVHSSLPLAVWTLCGVVIAGLDVFIVRAVDASETGRYAIALPLMAVPAGVVTATMSAWIPRVAGAVAGGRGAEQTLTGTTAAVAALAAGALLFMGFADELVGAWAGPGDWGSAPAYLQLLYLASALRFAFLPWAVLVLVRGEQRRITRAPVLEAVVNLLASVVLGLWLGAIGVALGTVAGAVVALVTYLAWAIPRTAAVALTPAALAAAVARAGVPLATAVPVVLLAVAGAPLALRAALAALALAVDAWWLVRRREPATVPPVRLEPAS